MPHELSSVDDLTEDLLKRTIEVYSKRSGEFVKFKLRTKKTLYTIKITPDEAANVEARIAGSGRSIEIIPQ
ncbi:MAG: hypothetical protein ACW98K_04310 [Candidatus Kariarchaeaceae archaeon]|jgi:hypothetical protein